MAAGQGFHTVTPCRASTRAARRPARRSRPACPGPSRRRGPAGPSHRPGGLPEHHRHRGDEQRQREALPRRHPTPTVSTLNFTAGLTRANNAITLLGTNGDLAALLSPAGTVHVIIDVNGYFE